MTHKVLLEPKDWNPIISLRIAPNSSGRLVPLPFELVVYCKQVHFLRRHPDSHRQLQNKLWRFGECRHMFPSSIQVFCLSEIVEPESRTIQKVEAVVADYQGRKSSEDRIDMGL
jgi:hypothetical protein